MKMLVIKSGIKIQKLTFALAKNGIDFPAVFSCLKG
jgi:hypothetical protein